MRSWKNKKKEAGRKNVCQMTAWCQRKKSPIAQSHRVTRFKIIVDGKWKLIRFEELCE